MAGASIFIASLWRRLVLSSIGRHSPESTQLNSYEIAYLTADSNRAIDVAIANLLHSGHLEILKSKGGFRRTSKQVYDGHPLEQAVLETVNTTYTGYTFKLIRQLVSPATKPIETRLQQLGLILTSGQAQLVRWLQCC